MKRLNNAMRAGDNLPTLDYDLALINGIFSIALKRYSHNIDGYLMIDIYYYNVKNINEQFLKKERFSIDIIPTILEFIKD